MQRLTKNKIKIGSFLINMAAIKLAARKAMTKVEVAMFGSAVRNEMAFNLDGIQFALKVLTESDGEEFMIDEDGRKTGRLLILNEPKFLSKVDNRTFVIGKAVGTDVLEADLIHLISKASRTPRS